MTHVPSYSDQQIRRRQRVFVKAHWRHLLLQGMAIGIPMLGCAGFFLYSGRTELAAAVASGALAVAAASLVVEVRENDGGYSWRMGRRGEENTAECLNQLRKAGWTIFNDISFEHLNIDHVAVGPGGVVAFETKWSADPLSGQPQRLERALDQAWRGARKIKGLLRSEVPVDIVPAVVTWSPQQPDLPKGVEVRDGMVALLNGRQHREWIPQLSSAQHLDAGEVAAATRVLNDFADMRRRAGQQRSSLRSSRAVKH